MQLPKCGSDYIIPDSIHSKLAIRGIKVAEIATNEENYKSWTLRFIADESRKCLAREVSLYFAENGSNLLGYEWEVLTEDGGVKRLVWTNDNYHEIKWKNQSHLYGGSGYSDKTGHAGIMC